MGGKAYLRGSTGLMLTLECNHFCYFMDHVQQQPLLGHRYDRRGIEPNLPDLVAYAQKLSYFLTSN